MEITRETLRREAAGFDTAEEWIYSIQTELGVYNAQGNRMGVGNYAATRTPEGEAKYEAISSQPTPESGNRGWFYIADDIWREAKGLRPRGY